MQRYRLAREKKCFRINPESSHVPRAPPSARRVVDRREEKVSPPFDTNKFRVAVKLISIGAENARLDKNSKYLV